MKGLLLFAVIVLVLALIPRMRFFLGVLIFGVTGPQGDHTWPNPVEAWKWSGTAAKRWSKK